jgi:hypothetical protein
MTISGEITPVNTAKNIILEGRPLFPFWSYAHLL